MCAQQDKGKVTLLLLPGMDGTGGFFKPFVACAADTPVTIVSYPESNYLTYEQLAQHVRNFIPASDPYVIVAESYSGPVASLLAEKPIGHLKAVVFVASFVSFPWRRIGSWLASIMPAALMRLRPPAWALRWFLMNSSASHEMVNQVQAVIARLSSDVLAQRLRAALKADFSQSLNKSGVRTICLVPDSDRLIGNWGYRSLVDAKPDIEVVRVAGPHFLLQCAPERCFAALRHLNLLNGI